MLGTFLETAQSLFDRRFLVVHWGPTLIGLGLAGGVTSLILGLPATLAWWGARDATEQILLGITALLASTLIAYLFESLTTPMMHFYEGISRRGIFTKLSYTFQKKRLMKLKKKLAAIRSGEKNPTPDTQRDFAYKYYQRYYHFPRDPALLRATHLGNILASAEEYAFQLYHLDAILWWPRLSALLPEAFCARIDAALAPMLALLNLCTWFILLALGGGLALMLTKQPWWLSLTTCGISLFLARVSYLAAVSQAVDYGQLVRVAFDLYRHRIFEQMSIPFPTTLMEERQVWDLLNAWCYHYIPPWEEKSVSKAETSVASLSRLEKYEPE